MATEIAQAYVHIFPSMEGVKGSLAQQITGEAESASEGVGSKFKNAFGTVTKVAIGAVGAASVAVGKLVSDSVSDYANYEQLVGGVETLFKNSAPAVERYASQAFKTAGLSANEYMETVTSFSASLLQSLDGDTGKAALVADKAIIDMSDNANKMGSSMESIQNAYQGFAKQNYTMLDNLKLGYGGTKSEMERLLADAGKLAGVEFNIDSYSDVIEAIHVIQESMDITGTTAKEASSTISGSINTMKSSWSNLITGMADDNADMDALIGDFIDSVDTVAQNILPRIEIALQGAGELLAKLIPEIIGRIPSFIQDTLPSLAQSAFEMIGAIGNGLIESLPTMIPQIVEMVLGMVEFIVDNIDLMVDGAIALITALAEGLVNALPILVEKAPEIIIKLLDAFIRNAPKMIDAAIEVIKTLATSLITNLPTLLAKVPEIIQKLLQAFLTLVSKYQEVGKNISNNIKDALGTEWTNILNAVGGWISNLVQAFLGKVSQFVQIGTNIVNNIKDAISNAWSNITGIASGLIEQAKNAFNVDWSSVGTNIVNGIKNGISNGWETLKGFVSQKANELLASAKKALGIKSPSREFADQVGQWIPAGIAKGIEKTASLVSEAVDDTLTGSIPNSVDVTNSVISSVIPSSRSYEGFGEKTQTTSKAITQVFNFGREIASPAEMARNARLEAQYGLMRGVALG